MPNQKRRYRRDVRPACSGDPARCDILLVLPAVPVQYLHGAYSRGSEGSTTTTTSRAAHEE